MTLKATITEDMKAAMRAREAARLSTIRLLLAAIKQKEVDERIEVSDADVVGIIDKMIKQRRESITHFDAGGRPELAAAERAEIELLQTYLPQPLSAAEVEALIAEAIANAGASGPSAMGKVMAALKPRLAGRADMGQVADRVRSKLAG
ncbi:MAG: GatB/YqeY domain-containing protein [Betaproteobacteria bacterium]|nr:MAG: GatB/YqeY domain-containing protein [Betaproteobacteria bacterium]